MLKRLSQVEMIPFLPHWTFFDHISTGEMVYPWSLCFIWAFYIVVWCLPCSCRFLVQIEWPHHKSLFKKAKKLFIKVSKLAGFLNFTILSQFIIISARKSEWPSSHHGNMRRVWCVRGTTPLPIAIDFSIKPRGRRFAWFSVGSLCETRSPNISSIFNHIWTVHRSNG